MTRLSQLDVTTLNPVLKAIKARTQGCGSLEQAAQVVTEILFDEFREAIVLVRMFATVPYGQLPPAIQAFVSTLAQSHNILPLINDDTAVLSLVGTSGSRSAWNDRRRSEGHIGIPLASADFVDRIPMMSRLLKEVGLGLDWISSRDTEIAVRAIGSISGVFYVPDAGTAIDSQGRKIIAAQDFVRANGVRSVFGLAGGYAISRTFATLIVFANEKLERLQAELFAPVINTFKGNTGSLASSGSIFSA
jgi:hypothetical protein